MISDTSLLYWSRMSDRIRKLVVVLALIAGGIGAAGFSGWVFDSEFFKRIHPAWVTMKANTGLGLMAAAVALLLLRDETVHGVKRRMAQVLGAAIALLGMLTLFEHFTHHDLGIDQWLFRESIAEAGQSFPGRMGVAASVNFTLIGVALVFFDARGFGRYRLCNICASLAIAITMLVFLYYFYGIEIEPIARYATMALHTVAAFLCLSVGMLLARPRRGIATTLLGAGVGSVAARRMLPAAILLPVLIGWFRVMGQQAHLYSTGFGSAMVAAATVLAFVGLIWWTARALDRDAAERERTELDLQEAHQQLANRAGQLESLVQERTAKLQEAITDMEAFSWSIVHDMRGPLRAMQGFAHLLGAEYANAGPDAQQYLTRIRTAAERMDRLIQDGLNYSRVMREDMPLVATDVAVLIRGIIETYPAFQMPQAKIEIADHLPLVRANEAALTQCVSNLLANAVKFVKPGVLPEIRIWAEAGEERVKVFFQDNGIGIDPAYHEKVFQIFQRLDQSYEGTGIGLAIVKKAAERMGGTAGVKSELDAGATFWVDLKSA